MVDPLRLAVGEVYDSGIKRWPGQELVLTTEGCVVLVACVSASAYQIRKFQKADIEFAWIDCPHNGILCCRFGDLDWEFLPFNPHRDTPNGMSPGVPTAASGECPSIAVGLAEIDGPVLATRTVTWPDDFAAVVAATVTRLAGQSFDSDAAADEANLLYVFEGAERLAQRAKVRTACA
ncbi:MULTISPECIES: hypothetical protein [unclassified Mycobacterium]|uniref:hypothetical protein n=1 Tax=unclassified Mycobacterium TaxID=2642494 RepID=UPI00048FBAF5|nr:MULTISPECIES: hypothetical protein [unclassified Mycobacterium]SEA30493.1 hypothetical protein SAMN04488580_102307 [Mycobacterium sp. 283mftsu]